MAASSGTGLGARLSRKVGPLPVWAWAVVILAVGYIVYKRRGSGSSGASSSTSASSPTASDASQTTPVPVTPDVTGTDSGATGMAAGTGTDLSGVNAGLAALEQQLQQLSASGLQYGLPPSGAPYGPTDTGPGPYGPGPSSPTPSPVAAYHPSFHAISDASPMFVQQVVRQSAQLGSTAPFGGVASTRTTATGVKIITYNSGRVVEQAPGHTAYVAHA